MVRSSQDAMVTIRLLLDEQLGVGQPVQGLGSRRSLLGVSSKPTSDDMLFIILEVVDDYEASQPVQAHRRTTRSPS